MDSNERWVAISERTFWDFVDLVERAMADLEPLQPNDALISALRGTIADMTVHSRQLIG